MRCLLAAVFMAGLTALPAFAAPTITEILAANKAASGGSAWDHGGTLGIDSAYSGQGLTGTTHALADLKTGSWADSYSIGPMTGGSGFDGDKAWMKDMSGTVTIQAGGDQRQIAINEAYRRANLWWRPGFSGATITSGGTKTDHGATYDVLKVTPKDGKIFTAWFDARTHLLARIAEKQGALTITTSYSAYRPVNGLMLPGKTVIDEGSGAKYLQTLSLAKANLSAKTDAADFAPPKVVVTDFTIAGDAKETIFPIRIINNHIYGDVMVNGKGPYNFIFDTGGTNILTPETAKALGVKTEGELPGHGVGTKVAETGIAKVDSLKLGDATVKHQVFVVMRFVPNEVEGVTVDGMVGFEVFRRFVTRIDYGGGTMTLTKPAAFEAKTAGTPIPFNFNSHIPQVKGSFEGLPGLFDIDTGARDEVTLLGPFVEKENLRAKHPKGVLVVDGWGVGGPARGYVTRGRELTLGPVTIPNVVASFSVQKKGAFSDASYQGNVGGGILKRFIVTFDYDHQIMYLKPQPGPVADTGVFDRSGMWINQAKDGMEVMDVTAGGPAAKAGVELGDVITMVNGKNATAIPVYELRRMLRNEAAGTVVTLTIKNAKGTHGTKLILADQI